jgi:hypothetical protein
LLTAFLRQRLTSKLKNGSIALLSDEWNNQFGSFSAEEKGAD